MTKKIINIDEMVLGWQQVFPMLYHAAVNDYLDKVEQAVFIVDGAPFDMSHVVHNLALLTRDPRWRWAKDRTPYEIHKQIPVDRSWTTLFDAGQCFRTDPGAKIAEDAKSFIGRIDILRLTPSAEYAKEVDSSHMGMGTSHNVLAFDDDADLVYWKMKHA